MFDPVKAANESRPVYFTGEVTTCLILDQGR